MKPSINSVPDLAPEIETDAYLDNVVWTSLTGAHSGFAQTNGAGRRYHPDFGPFGAADRYTEDSVTEIAGMLAPTERLTLFTMDKPVIPVGYDIVREAVAIQMVGTRDFAAPEDRRIVKLGDEDVTDMLKLVEATDPGPFKQRTNELGNFIGIRESGKLIAMAGERMIAGRYVEVSAVCTHPDYRGKGLARILMTQLCSTIQSRGSVPMLHVFTSNASAVRLYRELGFRNARNLNLTALMRSPANES